MKKTTATQKTAKKRYLPCPFYKELKLNLRKFIKEREKVEILKKEKLKIPEI